MVPSERDPSSPSDRLSEPVRLPGPRAGDFPAFAREHPTAAARAFESLSLEDRARIVTRAPVRDRITLILLSRDTGALVRALPAPDFFFTVKEAEDDAPDLLRLASPEQVKVCLDLDCWNRDALDLDSVTGWLALLQESSEKFGEVLAAIDLEVLIAWLRSRARVWKAEADGSLPPDAPEGLQTIDGVYLLEPLGSGVDMPLVRALLIEARSRDEVFYWRLLEGTIHELDAELELQAFQWREARLSDEGFPSLDDALAVYGRLDPRRFRPEKHRKPQRVEPVEAPGDATMTIAPRTDLAGDLLLVRAWEAGLRAGGWEAIEEEMAYLLNRVLVADGARFDAPEGVQALFRRAWATLGLGLEAALDRAGEREGRFDEADVQAAVRLLRETRLDALLRLGYTRTLEVRDAALRAESESEAWTAILDPPLPGVVAAAKRRRPLFFEGISAPDSTETREFRTLRDVGAALRVMRWAAALRSLWEDLRKQAVAGSLGEDAPRTSPMRLSGLAITAFAARVLDGMPALRPIPRSRLRALHEALFATAGPACAEPTLRSDARARLHEAFGSWLESLEPEAREDAGRFLDSCLERLRAEVGVLDPDTADPRAVSAILLSRG